MAESEAVSEKSELKVARAKFSSGKRLKQVALYDVGGEK